MDSFPDIILDSLFLIIAIVIFIVIGSLFFLLGKIPLFRWIGRFIFFTIKYTFMTIINLLFSILLSLMTTAGVIAIILACDYLQWDLFLVGQEALTLIHDDFFTASFLISFCFVLGILVGTLILSFIKLSMQQYVILSYLFGVLSIFFLLPVVLNFYAPTVQITMLGSILLVTIIPIIAVIFAIATGQKRKERRRGMTYQEKKREDNEEKRKENFRREAIFPWIRNRKTA